MDLTLLKSDENRLYLITVLAPIPILLPSLAYVCPPAQRRKEASCISGFNEFRNEVSDLCMRCPILPIIE